MLNTFCLRSSCICKGATEETFPNEFLINDFNIPGMKFECNVIFVPMPAFCQYVIFGYSDFINLEEQNGWRS